MLLVLLRSTQAADLQSLGVEANQREGSAQLVRDIRHEIRFQLRERHFLRYVAIGQPDAARQQHRKASDNRSEEHTSELQSRLHLVCRLLLEKKKNFRPPPSATRCRTSTK